MKPPTQPPVGETEAPTPAPVETEAPTSAPVVTEAPATETPTAPPVETDVPATAPTTTPAETDAPTTAPADTEAPTTAPADTEAPTTAPAETEAPTTPDLPVEISNDICAGAIPIPFGETISASTAGSTMDGMFVDCGTAKGGNQSAPGRWFATFGIGGEMMVVVNASYDMQLVLYKGSDCDSLTCVDGTEGLRPDFDLGYVIFDSVPGSIYYILVSGFGGAVGSFDMYVSNAEEAPNDECLGAEELAIDVPVAGSTIFSMDNETDDYCTGLNTSAPGIWYKYTAGTESKLQASITGNDYLAQISVYSGSCEDLVCTGGKYASRARLLDPVVWDATEGEDYFILVHGFDGQVGTFGLVVAVPEIPENDECEAAIELSVPSTGTNGTTVAAGLDSVTHCGR
jgi:hypothetical protein